VSHRATAPYTSSRMRITTRFMMAAVVLTVNCTWFLVIGLELIWRAALVEIRYRITPNTMANVTPIWQSKSFLINYKKLVWEPKRLSLSWWAKWSGSLKTDRIPITNKHQVSHKVSQPRGHSLKVITHKTETGLFSLCGLISTAKILL